MGTLQTHELKPDVESFLYPPPPRLLPPVITEKQLAPRFITQEFERQFSSVAPEEAAARVPLTPKVSILTEPSCQSLVNGIFFTLLWFMHEFAKTKQKHCPPTNVKI